jgi:hypothetical protein
MLNLCAIKCSSLIIEYVCYQAGDIALDEVGKTTLKFWAEMLQRADNDGKSISSYFIIKVNVDIVGGPYCPNLTIHTFQ